MKCLNFFREGFSFFSTLLLVLLLSNFLPAQIKDSGKFKYENNQRIDTKTNIVAAWYNVDSRVYSGTPEQIARLFLIENKNKFGISNVSELELLEIIQSPAGKHVGFIQKFNNVPVYASETVVSINRDNRVTMVINGNSNNINITDVNPRISAASALSSVKSYKMITENEILIGIPKTELVIYKDSLGVYYLSWKVNIISAKLVGDWQAFVDANTGKIISIHDISKHYVNGQGKVFDPDPITSLQNTSLTDSNNSDYQALQNSYIDITLQDLNDAIGGLYYVKGRYARSEDIEAPYTTPVSNSSASFLYNRSQSGFEEVNAYYFIDAQRRYIGNLGFSPQWNSQDYIRFDAHGQNGYDQSAYMESQDYLTFGDGGIDDAEDQDVILHEYGHALHDALMVGEIGWYNHSHGVSEGIGDYLAVSFRRTRSSFQANKVFPWDGNGEFWDGRSLEADYEYPYNWDYYYDYAVYEMGTTWASTMMDMEDSGSIGRNVTTKLLLTSLSYVTGSSTARDHVNAIFQADRDIYDGSHLHALSYIFNQRGFFFENQVSGTISSNTAWSGSKYVTGDVTVNSGVTLTISSNTFIFFANGTSLTINGTLNAVGNASAPIVFTHSGSSGTWDGITFYNNTAGTLSYCDISNAQIGITCSFAREMEITNCNIHDNTSAGIYIDDSGPLIVDNEIRDNGSYGIWVYDDSTPITAHNIITGHSIAGIYANSASQISDYNLGGTSGSNAIRSNTNGKGIYANYASEIIFGDGSYGGSNSICSNTNQEAYATSYSTITTQGNWWGGYPPSASEFYTDGTSSIDYSNYLSSDPNPGMYKISAPLSSEQIVSNSSGKPLYDKEIKSALSLMLNKKYEEAINKFEQKFKKESNISKKRYCLVKISQCYKRLEKAGFVDYLNSVVRQNISKEDELYGVTLELENSSLLRAGKYDNVIENLNTIKENYSKDEEMYKQALYKLAYVYGKYLKDESKTKEYLDELESKYPADQLVYDGKILLLREDAKPTAPKEDKNVAVTASNKFELQENFPNPFNPTTTISYTLPENGTIQIKIYDVLGREVATLIDGFKTSGKHSVTWNANNVASGIYFYSIVFNKQRIYKKMLLMK